MSFLEEIAQRIDKALDGDCGYGVGEDLAEMLSPLIAKHDARVRADELRRARLALVADQVLTHGIVPHDVGMAIHFLAERADRIEKEAGR